MINHIFMVKNVSDIKNNKTPHIFTPPRPLGSGGVKIWGVLLFLNIMKIENNDFITILGSANLNVMMFSTNYCSNPTVNVPGGSMTHAESPWTLNIMSILFSASGDLILSSKSNLSQSWPSFMIESHREVPLIGLESIELWCIRTKYIDFLTRHTQHVCTSFPTINCRIWPC